MSKRIGISEILIYGSKSDICNFVDIEESVHDILSDLSGSDLSRGLRRDHALHFITYIRQHPVGHGTLGTRGIKSCKELVSREFLSCSVLLDNLGLYTLNALQSREAFAAALAFAAPPDSIDAVSIARIYDLAVLTAAFGTSHLDRPLLRISSEHEPGLS